MGSIQFNILPTIPYIGLVHLLLLIVTIPRILYIKRNPTAAITWIFGVLLTPILGSLLFAMAGDPELRRPLRRIIRGPSLTAQGAPRKRPRFMPPGFVRLERMLGRLEETPATFGNACRFFTDGGELYEAMRRDIESARHEICVQFFIFRPDAAGREALDLLSRKAKEGVRVYFLYDAVGALRLQRAKGVLREARAAGVRHHPFLPIAPLRRRIQINFRNHRKLVVVDRRVAYTGGFNVGLEYMGRSARWRHWYDAHVRLEGPCVPQLFESFQADWDFACEDPRDAMEEDPAWFDKDAEPPNNPDDAGEGWVQTVTSGPDQRVNRMHQVLFFAITRAQTRLWIATPYFVPDESLLVALKSAALSGVDVRLMTQNNRPDHWVPHLAMRYYWQDMLDAGVTVLQYQPGMMHAKMLLVDDRLASVGSTNLDVRSVALNFEANIIFYSRKEREEIEQLFEEAFERCTAVGEEYRKRPVAVHIAEDLARLFSPLL